MSRPTISPLVKRFLVLVMAIGLIQAGNAQSGPIKRSWAFAKEISYGRELRDMDGNPVQRKDTAFFLYLETSSKNEPQIRTVIHRGRSFQASVYAVAENETVSGIDKKTSKAFTLKKKTANRLWRVELSPVETQPLMPARSYISVSGALDRKPFSLRLKEFTLLQPDNAG